MRCLGCRYNLKNLTERRCPECGRVFDPNDFDTFNSGPGLWHVWRIAADVVMIIVLLSLALFTTFWLTGSDLHSAVVLAISASLVGMPICLFAYVVVSSARKRSTD